MKVIPTPEQAAQCFAYYEKLIEPLRMVAMDAGYALAVHGSLRRDIDLIACPWVVWAIDPCELAERLFAEAKRVTDGRCFRADSESGPYFLAGSPGMKSHRRLVWVFHLVGSGGPYIDLSVMSRCEDLTVDELIAMTDAKR